MEADDGDSLILVREILYTLQPNSTIRAATCLLLTLFYHFRLTESFIFYFFFIKGNRSFLILTLKNFHDLQQKYFDLRVRSGIIFRRGLGPIFFILDINGALNIFENVSVLGYADDLKLFMRIKCIGDCQLFQRDLDRLGEWCRSNKFDLNAGKCKSISFRRNMRPIEFVYSINGKALERVNEIKDLGVIIPLRHDRKFFVH
jgi:hypothetical protein